MLSQEEAIRLQNNARKAKERQLEKVLLKFYAWERYPGESWNAFKFRFRSIKILVDLQSLPEKEREDILKKIHEQYPIEEQGTIT